MDTGVLFRFDASQTDLVFHGASETRRISAASDAIFQQLIATHLLADSLPFVQLDGRMAGSHVVLHHDGKRPRRAQDGQHSGYRQNPSVHPLRIDSVRSEDIRQTGTPHDP